MDPMIYAHSSYFEPTPESEFQALLGNAQGVIKTQTPEAGTPRPPLGMQIVSEGSQGGIKHDGGKPPMSLLDRSHLEGVARVLAFGAKKYDAHNWRKGLSLSRLMDAALRHAFAFVDGENLDPETGECHLYHAACCLMFASKMFETRTDLDDRHTKETK